ncbi:hypothetical protein [Pseudomonas sp. PA27(2017)]|uniref:hypothetical protein n=1 Tax=Pseudomonas sp. PA27(2017) TaxID=1932112 RepID=UPI001115079A|nr:hypothetical protein [Pseudomonas sp. PA27(2017)]
MSSVVTSLLKAASWQEQANEHGLLLSPLSVSVSPAQAPLLKYAIDLRETVAYVSASEVDVAQRADFHQSAGGVTPASEPAGLGACRRA